MNHTLKTKREIPDPNVEPPSFDIVTEGYDPGDIPCFTTGMDDICRGKKLNHKKGGDVMLTVNYKFTIDQKLSRHLMRQE